jgi:hypothetical protein
MLINPIVFFAVFFTREHVARISVTFIVGALMKVPSSSAFLSCIGRKGFSSIYALFASNKNPTKSILSSKLLNRVLMKPDTKGTDQKLFGEYNFGPYLHKIKPNLPTVQVELL